MAIVITGPVAKDIATRFRITAKRAASLLDLFASSFQGVIPYGAQVLAAVSFAEVSPLVVAPYNFYGFLTFLCGLAAISFRFPR